MDAIILKSFLPEIFFSLIILLQILLNTNLVNSLKWNFPLIEKELFYQNFFIFIIIFIFLHDLRIEGFLSTYTLYTSFEIYFVKKIFVLTCFLVLILVYNINIFQRVNFFEFSSLYFLSILGLLITLSSQELLIFYLVMEVQTLCFYVLSSSNRTSIFSVESGLKYYVSGSFMSAMYLLGVFGIYISLGTLNLHNISLILSHSLSTYSQHLITVLLMGIVLVIVSILFKLACAPFHFWSPDVYDGAPLSSTIIFSIIPKLPLYFFLMKFLTSIREMGESSFLVSTVLIICGALSVLLGTVFALSQKRLKRLVVYSSLVQTGFITMGLSAYAVNPLNAYYVAFNALYIYIITSLLIWGILILYYLFSYKSNSFDGKKKSDVLYVSTLNNLIIYSDRWTLIFVVIFFSVGGIPPFPGFLSKILVVLQLVTGDLEFYASIVLMIISSIAVYYYIRLVKVAFFESKKKIKSKEFKTNYSGNNLNLLTLILILLILVLLFAFYQPTIFLLASQLIALNILTL